jgi:hypothetical protein
LATYFDLIIGTPREEYAIVCKKHPHIAGAVDTSILWVADNLTHVEVGHVEIPAEHLRSSKAELADGPSR